MYYEMHGQGPPLIVLHGAFDSIDAMGGLIDRFAESRRVIAPEAQGHGRTADIDRPLSYEAMADDVDALMAVLDIPVADVFGFSMGAGTALQLAIRHPERIDRLILASIAYRSDGFYPEIIANFQTATAASFVGTPYETEYKRLAPHPDAFATLADKLLALDRQTFAWGPELLGRITAPTMIVVGDSDIVTPEHAVEMFRLFGGGVPGDLTGLPDARLAVLPGTKHTAIITRIDWLDGMTTEFLDSPSVSTEPG